MKTIKIVNGVRKPDNQNSALIPRLLRYILLEYLLTLVTAETWNLIS